MLFGKFAHLKRKQAGLSQHTVAQAMGFKYRSEVSRKEGDLVEWKLSEVEILASLLGIKASELLAEYEDTLPIKA